MIVGSFGMSVLSYLTIYHNIPGNSYFQNLNCSTKIAKFSHITIQGNQFSSSKIVTCIQRDYHMNTSKDLKITIYLK